MSDIIDTKELMTIADDKNFENFTFFFLSNNYHKKRKKNIKLSCRNKKKKKNVILLSRSHFKFQIAQSSKD